MDLVILTLKDRFFLSPHGQDHLDGLAEAPQALSSIGIVVAIGAILVLMPASSDAEGESPVREHIDRAGHFGEQGGIAIAVARDCLTNTDAPGITRQGGGGRPALKRDFLRWPWGRMKVIDKPGGRETDFVGSLGHTRHHLVGFNGVLDACQFHPCGRDTPNCRDIHTSLDSANNGRTFFLLIGAILTPDASDILTQVLSLSMLSA